MPKMKSIEYTRASKEEELLQILELQAANRPEVLSPDGIKREGFVTVKHDLELLRRMNDRCPHILAKDGDTVAGYALCMHPEFKEEISIIAPMFRRAEKLLPDKSFIVMGQVCVGKQYRKMGIFRKLYEAMADAVLPDFDLIVTEVDDTNQRSLQAHLAVGFKVLEEYEADGRKWHLIILG